MKVVVNFSGGGVTVVRNSDYLFYFTTVFSLFHVIMTFYQHFAKDYQLLLILLNNRMRFNRNIRLFEIHISSSHRYLDVVTHFVKATSC